MPPDGLAYYRARRQPLLAWLATPAMEARLSALPVPSSDPLPTGDIHSLWRLCLALAQRRRQRLPACDADLALEWSATHGYALRGAWDTASATLFDLLKPLLDRQGALADWTIGQLGQSLDGCIATHTGDSYFVNGPDGLVHLHRLRALCDAVIVGASTACLDNPQLTTRRVPGANPTRVVLDPTLRVPADARVFNDGQAPTLLVCDEAHRARAEDRLGADKVIVVARGGHGQLQLPELVQALRQLGLRTLFVEGGGVTVSQFVQQGCLDRLHLIVAPLLIGAGHPGLQVRRSDAMADALRPPARSFVLGSDVLWDLDLRSDGTAPQAKPS
jgi:diaminohydroxyphosphoribosylaminopyrimidine deaminase/5-amino-6-(5-phosphoribosylamino)uracil reductase